MIKRQKKLRGKRGKPKKQKNKITTPLKTKEDDS